MSSYVSKSFILVRFYRSVSRIHIKPSPLVIDVYRWWTFAQTASVSASNGSLLSIIVPRYLMDNFNSSAMNKNRGGGYFLKWIIMSLVLDTFHQLKSSITIDNRPRRWNDDDLCVVTHCTGDVESEARTGEICHRSTSSHRKSTLLYCLHFKNLPD